MQFIDYMNTHYQELINLGYSIDITLDHSKKKGIPSKVHFYLKNQFGRKLKDPYAYLNRYNIKTKHLIAALPGTPEDGVIASLLQQVLKRHLHFYTASVATDNPQLQSLQSHKVFLEVYKANSPENGEHSYRLYLVDENQKRILNSNATTIFTHTKKLTVEEFQKIEYGSALDKAMTRLLDIYESHQFDLDEWSEYESTSSKSNIINKKRIKV